MRWSVRSPSAKQCCLPPSGIVSSAQTRSAENKICFLYNKYGIFSLPDRTEPIVYLFTASKYFKSGCQFLLHHNGWPMLGTAIPITDLAGSEQWDWIALNSSKSIAADPDPFASVADLFDAQLLLSADAAWRSFWCAKIWRWWAYRSSVIINRGGFNDCDLKYLQPLGYLGLKQSPCHALL